MAKYEGKMADVEQVELIYTRIKYLNGMIVSIPNQKLLQTDITNLSKSDVMICRNIKVT